MTSLVYHFCVFCSRRVSPIKYYYEDIEKKTGKSHSTVKRWRREIEKIAGYKFEQEYIRTSKKTYNWIYVFTEDEVRKFVLLADELCFGEKLDSSIKKVWGDLDAQLEKNLSEEIGNLWGAFKKYQIKVSQDIKELEDRNTGLAQRVSALETKLKELEEEKSKGFFSFRR